MKLVYLIAVPKIDSTRLKPLNAMPDLQGAVADKYLDPAIIVANEPTIATTWWDKVKSFFTGTPAPTGGRIVVSALIPDENLEAVRQTPEFLGVGLNEVKVKAPELYNLVAQKRVRLKDRRVVSVNMADATPEGGEVLSTDNPLHNYLGWDPWTGELELPQKK
jgi:hypothetical protein